MKHIPESQKEFSPILSVAFPNPFKRFNRDNPRSRNKNEFDRRTLNAAGDTKHYIDKVLKGDEPK